MNETTDKLLFAAVADDDTGASDLAGMLAQQGVRTLLVIDLPPAEKFLKWMSGHQAVVMAEGTRNLPPAEARTRTRAALNLLAPFEARVTAIKYCSTFDSTPAGNIGPTIDVALEALNEDFTIAVPALPVNGRTTYQGYHFVHHQLLSDSPMRDHPLTPMTNPNLVDLLGRQTKRQVGLAAFHHVQAGVEQLSECFREQRRRGIEIAVVDCLSDEHLETICRAAVDLRLITGGSAFGIKLPAIWRERGWLKADTEEFAGDQGATNLHGCLVVAGSCSAATRTQNEQFIRGGGTALRLDPCELLEGSPQLKTLIVRSCDELKANRHCLVYTSDAPGDVRRVQEWGAGRGYSVPELGAAIAQAMADLTRTILERQLPAGLIVAGGETSGAICRRLELGALRVNRNIEPGVPLCFALGRFQLPIVLKSGNFGSPDFYDRAFQVISRAIESSPNHVVEES